MIEICTKHPERIVYNANSDMTSVCPLCQAYSEIVMLQLEKRYLRDIYQKLTNEYQYLKDEYDNDFRSRIFHNDA